MAEGDEGSLQEAVEESELPFDPPLERENLPDLKEAFYLNGDHIREQRDMNGEVEELGKGAFGHVTKVFWNELPCAAKELRDDLLTDENRTRATKGFFVESLKLAGRLRHPNIVQYIGLWKRPNGNDVIVMELLPRKSLTHFLHNTAARRFSVPLRVTRRILIDVCCAMIYLHNLRPCVLHRDLTSNNILLTSDFRAKVTDFGQARLYTDADQEKLNMTRQPGTKDFMPPEALLPQPKYGKPLDRFSFGCVTLQMLTHKWPKPKRQVDRDMKPTPWEDRKYLLSKPSREERDEFIKPIIVPCLDTEPKKRPTFEDIYKSLTTSTDVLTDEDCIRMLNCDVDPASARTQNRLLAAEALSPTVMIMNAAAQPEVNLDAHRPPRVGLDTAPNSVATPVPVEGNACRENTMIKVSSLSVIASQEPKRFKDTIEPILQRMCQCNIAWNNVLWWLTLVLIPVLAFLYILYY